MGKWTGQQVDVLIVTAIKDEYDAVLEVHTGSELENTWSEQPGPLGLSVAFRTFLTTDGGLLRVAVTRALEMGGVAAANAASPLVHLYRPRCIAMCGVCAGRRGDVNLGDVIVADRLWTYDTGSTVVERDEQGREVQRFKADPFTYTLSALWKHKAESFRPDGLEAWEKQRPRPYENQAEWLLARLLAVDDPRTHPERKNRCANFDKLVPKLRERGWLEPAGLKLTEAGRVYIEEKLLLHPDGLPENEAFAVRVGPIGTGTTVVRDPHIFGKLSDRMRKVLGLEMEAAAIGAIAHLYEVEHLLVMKGVMDYADLDKSDNFKPFAARASAECLLAFLRHNLESKRDAPPETQRAPPTLVSTGGGATASEVPSPAANPFQSVGTLEPGHLTYVTRSCDVELETAVVEIPLVAIEGEYRIGKSSLLVHAHAAFASIRSTCYVDLSGLRTDDATVFHKTIFRELSRQLGRTVDDWIDLKDAADRRPLVLCLDEFGHLTPHVARLFVPALHHLVTHRKDRVCVLVCLPDSIEDFVRSCGLVNPKYCSGWRRVRVGPFDEGGVKRLLSLLPPRARGVADSHREIIVARSRCHPQAIQSLCYELFDADVRGLGADALAAMILRRRWDI